MWFNSASLLSLIATAASVTALPVDETTSLVERSANPLQFPDLWHFTDNVRVPNPLRLFTGQRKQAIRGFDISSPMPLSWFQCAKKNGYGKAVFRAYTQACGAGGQVDPNFLTEYRLARQAGFTDIDAYMWPCTGTQNNGKRCKSIQTQLNELMAVIRDNKLQINRLWLDVEPNEPGFICQSWKVGSKEGALNLARQWVAAIKATKMNWGIYGNGGQWLDMFPEVSSNIGSDLPLWAVEMGSPDIAGTKRLMGGWTRATAKQWRLDTKLPECSSDSRVADLNSFLS
ncbi:MAG: hypothetical protein M1823_001640 [Watsoniomyces obsoletus]|nr:MAG: hypothetical protein M1823_001640 [Watsoniomyces obsoletus]